MEKISFECHCHSPEHLLRFYLEEEGNREKYLYASVFLNEDRFFKRLWQGLKYIFGYKCKYGHFDEFILNPEDADRFIDMLKKFKE